MKTTSYDKYVQFVDSVVSNTVDDGEEFKTFYTTLMFAIVFLDYEPKHIDKDGHIIISDEWEELSKIKFTDKNKKDFYLAEIILSPYINFSDSDDLDFPVSQSVFDDMLDTINEKLRNYYNRQSHITPLTESLVAFVNLASDFVVNMENQFKNTDVDKLMSSLDTVTNAINNVDKKEFSKNVVNKARSNTTKSKTTTKKKTTKTGDKSDT